MGVLANLKPPEIPLQSGLLFDDISSVLKQKSNGTIATELFIATVLWGGNNVAVKYQVMHWPPVITASTRFLLAGAALLLVMRFTDVLGKPTVLTDELRRGLWTRGAVSLAVYIVVFVWAVKMSSPSTVALFMGTSPVWALLLEEKPHWDSLHKYVAALLALVGVVVLFLPALSAVSIGRGALFGNLLALLASVLWTVYSRQCRRFTHAMSGLELTGQTFWRAGIFLLPIAVVEWVTQPVRWDVTAAWLQVYAVLLSGLLAFGLWNDALRVWPTSRAFLFGNLIPITTMAFSYLFMGEKITVHFWIALGLILSAVLIGQLDWKQFNLKTAVADDEFSQGPGDKAIPNHSPDP